MCASSPLSVRVHTSEFFRCALCTSVFIISYRVERLCVVHEWRVSGSWANRASAGFGALGGEGGCNTDRGGVVKMLAIPDEHLAKLLLVAAIVAELAAVWKVNAGMLMWTGSSCSVSALDYGSVVSYNWDRVG